jgi:hypothetical protein
MGYRLCGRGSIPSRVRGIFLYYTASRLALEPIQPPIQWIPGVLSPEVKHLGCEVGITTPTRSGMVKLYLHSYIHLHGMLK